jgi:cell division protease FtsH
MNEPGSLPKVIDGEVQRLVTEQYVRAQALLRDHHAAHETLARQLLKQETVSGNDVKAALENNRGPGSPADAAQLQRRPA